MKTMLYQTITEMASDEKIAKATIGVGVGVSTGTVLEWLPTVVGLVASIVTIMFTLYLWYSHSKKNKREDELDRAELEERLLRIEILKSEKQSK